MSKIDDLIQRLCPKGVPYQELQVLFDTRNGYTPSKSDASNWTNGTIPWFRMEDLRNNGRVLDESIQRIPASAAKGGRLFPANSILMATSATIGEHALITVPHLSNQRFTSLSLKKEYVDQLDMKFVFYYCFVLDEWCRNNTAVSSFASVDMAGFKKFKFPIPPVEVQREVVRVLDLFTELAAELEAELDTELEKRRQQYAQYRDSMLISPKQGEVTWSTLPAMSVNRDSQRKPVTKSVREAGEIPYYGASGIVDYVSDYIFDGDYLLVSEDGANLLARSTPIAFSVSGRTWVNNHAHVLEFPSYAQRRYVEIYLNSIDLASYITGGAQPKLNKANLNKIPIPVLSVDEQSRIVDVLDNFEALVNGLIFGLLAELNARRKQYQFYLDKLLTFQEFEA